MASHNSPIPHLGAESDSNYRYTCESLEQRVLLSSGSGGGPVLFAGHYYELIADTVTWQQAANQARERFYNGWQGHLVTLTSQPEDAFVLAEFGGSGWLGGYQPAGSTEKAGGWRWTTGEVWSYTNWGANEPNNQYQPHLQDYENALAYNTQGKWNDNSGKTRLGYVVEYEQRFSAGVTIITHGFRGSLPAWVFTMADVILDRADGVLQKESYGSVYVSNPTTADWSAPTRHCLKTVIEGIGVSSPAEAFHGSSRPTSRIACRCGGTP